MVLGCGWNPIHTFIEHLLCTGDPVGNEVTILPAYQCNRKLCSHNGRNSWSNPPSPIQGSFSYRQLIPVSKVSQPGFPMFSAPWSLSEPSTQKHKPGSPEVMESSLSCPEAGLHLLSKRTSSLCLHASRDEMLSISTRKMPAF